MKRGQLPEAPNYTNAALVMGFVNLLWILAVLWAIFGLPVVLAISYVLNHLINRIDSRA